MLHPTVRLIVWGAAAAFVQWLPLADLSLACVVALVAGGLLASKRLGILLRRARWLIASLVVLFALATPGVYLLPSLGSLGPTEEGLRLGFEHLMRLFFVLATLAVLLQMTGTEGLVAGLHGLMLPLGWLGLDRGRVAVRLMLVMHYVEQSNPGRHWREWLDSADSEATSGTVRLSRVQLAWADFAVLTGLTFGAIAYFGSVP